MNTLTVCGADKEVHFRQIISAIEDERARIARELHDDIAQRLAMNALELRLLYDDIPATQAQVRAHVLKVHQQLVEVADDVGGLSRRLHPSIVKHLGVVAAIRSECENFAKLRRSLVAFECHCHLGNLSEATALALFRIAQEALRNVAKHAAKATVHVTLERIDRNLRLCVEDDGPGFDTQHCRPGLGLLSMHERAAVYGGRLKIQSTPGKGTRVEAILPLNHAT